jgi:hypothetical protein
MVAVNGDSECELLASLPAMLDRIDAWIDAGVLNAESLNTADFMIVTSLALLRYRRDLRPQIEARLAGQLIERVLPEPSRSGSWCTVSAGTQASSRTTPSGEKRARRATRPALPLRTAMKKGLRW